MSKFEKLVDQQNLHHTEGARGVMNLCKIACALGYKDEMRFGQLDRDAFVGDLIEFLQDNSGCIEAMHNWIEENQHCWEEQIESQLEESDEDEENDDE